MKASIKLINPNGTGQNSFEEYQTIKELKNYLNHCLYYSGEVYLNVPSLSNYDKYSETSDIASLVSDANFYGERLEIIPSFEDVEI